MDKKLRDLQRAWVSTHSLLTLRRYTRELLRSRAPVDDQEFDYLVNYFLEYLNSEFRTLELMHDAHNFIRLHNHFLMRRYSNSYGWFSKFIAELPSLVEGEITALTFQHHPNLDEFATDYYRGLLGTQVFSPYLYYSKRYNKQQNILEVGELPRRVWDSTNFTTGVITWSDRIAHGAHELPGWARVQDVEERSENWPPPEEHWPPPEYH